MTRPWPKGVHPSHTSFDIEVRVCQSTEGALYTQHALSEEDCDIASSLKSGGEEQIAFALLCEAVRREAFLQVLIQGGQDETFLGRYRKGEEKERVEMERALAEHIQAQMLRTVHRLSFDKAKEILTLLSKRG